MRTERLTHAKASRAMAVRLPRELWLVSSDGEISFLNPRVKFSFANGE